MQIKTGQILALTEGEYSDYTLLDHVKVLKDFDSVEIFDQFRREYGTEHGSKSQFIPWAIRQGLFESLTGEEDVLELYIGAYGRFNPSI